MPGIEYILQDAQTPQLFVIRKQSKSLSGEETTLAIYYILHGMLYQAPVLYDVLSSRLDRASFTLQNILSEMRNDLDPMLRKNIPLASIESTSKKTGFKGEDVFDVSEDPELKAERRRRAEQAITSALLAHPLPRSASALGSEVEDCRPPMSSDEQREAPGLTQ